MFKLTYHRFTTELYQSTYVGSQNLSWEGVKCLGKISFNKHSNMASFQHTKNFSDEQGRLQNLSLFLHINLFKVKTGTNCMKNNI